MANPFESAKIVRDLAATMQERMDSLMAGEGELDEIVAESRESLEMMESHLDILRDVSMLGGIAKGTDHA